MLIAMNKILAECEQECDEEDNRLKALQELRYAVAYANEYITDQAVYIHPGMTDLMHTLTS